MALPKFQKNNKLFWLYIALGIFVCLLSVLLVPSWRLVEWAPWRSWSTTLINLIISLFLSLYLFGFLINKITRSRNRTIKILTIIEFSVLLLIDISLVLGQWISALNIIPIVGACRITGLALWLRGVVEIIRAYLFKKNSNNEDIYPIWWLFIVIAFVSFGMLMMANPFISDEKIVWVFDVVLLGIGISMIGYGIYAKPKKSKKKEVSKK